MWDSLGRGAGPEEVGGREHTKVRASFQASSFISQDKRVIRKVGGFPGGTQVAKNPPANAGDVGSIPGLGRSPGEGHSNPLQYSWWENSMDRETGRLQSMGLQRVRHGWAHTHSKVEWKTHCFIFLLCVLCSFPPWLSLIIHTHTHTHTHTLYHHYHTWSHSCLQKLHVSIENRLVVTKGRGVWWRRTGVRVWGQ